MYLKNLSKTTQGGLYVKILSSSKLNILFEYLQLKLFKYFHTFFYSALALTLKSFNISLFSVLLTFLMVMFEHHSYRCLSFTSEVHFIGQVHMSAKILVVTKSWNMKFQNGILIGMRRSPPPLLKEPFSLKTYLNYNIFVKNWSILIIEVPYFSIFKDEFNGVYCILYLFIKKVLNGFEMMLYCRRSVQLGNIHNAFIQYRRLVYQVR